MKRRLGYYAHHHGAGHLLRATQLAHRCETPVTVLSSGSLASNDEVPEHVDLVRDDGGLGPDHHYPLPEILHYAPVGHAGLRQRIAQLAGWFAEAEPAAVVVDVSVEVTLLARLAGVAPVVVRQFGRRTDPAHRAAYDAALEVVAFWPEWAEDPETPEALRDRTRYVGGTSRLEGRFLDRDDACRLAGLDPRQRYVVVLRGAGGDAFSADQIADAARATPDLRWVVLGDPPRGAPTAPAAPTPAAPTPAATTTDGAGALDAAQVRYLGYLGDPLPVLRCAEVVVTHGGQNAVMDAAAAEVPLVVLPQARPFAEQERFAAVLEAEGCAVVRRSWPTAAAWPSVLRATADLDRDRVRELVDDGAGAAAKLLDELVTYLLTDARSTHR